MIIKIIIMILIIIMIIIIIDHWWTQEFQHVLWNSEAEYDHMSHDHPHMLEDSCPLTTNNKIFANSWGMYSLLWDSACNHSALQITKTIPFYFSLSNCFKTIVALFLTFFEKIWLLIFSWELSEIMAQWCLQGQIFWVRTKANTTILHHSALLFHHQYHLSSLKLHDLPSLSVETAIGKTLCVKWLLV